MKIKRLIRFGSSLVISMSSLLVLSNPVVHASGVTLFWCNPAGGDFNTASNWNTDSDCSSGTQEVPVSGDSLIFDNTNLTTGAAINNDISGLDINNITFQGSNSSNLGFVITGDAMSLDNGITESSSATVDELGVDLTLTDSQTFSDISGRGGALDVGDTSFAQTLNIGSNTLTLDSAYGNSGGVISIDSQLIGSGGIVLNGDSNGAYDFSAATTGFTGTTTIDNGQAYLFDPTALGTGAINVANGAGLSGSFSGTVSNFSNPLTVGGNGLSSEGALIFNDDCPSPGSSGTCANDGTVTLSGPMTLTADTTLNAEANVNVTGSVTGGCLSSVSGSSGTLSGNSGTCNASSAGTSGTSGTNAPKTPDTGFALTRASVALPMLSTIAVATSLYIISRKLKHPATKQR